jgi:hypothetical protein
MKKFVNTAGLVVHLVLSVALMRLIYAMLFNAMLYFGLYVPSIIGALVWIVGTLMALMAGTLLFGLLALGINRISPFSLRKVGLLILTPLVIASTLYQCWELYKVPYIYGLQAGGDWSYVAYACIYFMLLFFTVKSYKMLTLNRFAH